MSRHEFFKKRLTEMGLYDKDSDYDGMIGKAVEELSETFSKQGHSGCSAEIALSIFNGLMEEWKNPQVVNTSDTLPLPFPEEKDVL